MKIYRSLSLVLGLGLALGGLLACRATAPAGAAAAVELIRFERTACMGSCPVDVLTIYTDGLMRYEGRQDSPRLGRYSGRLTADERAALVQAFETAHFFDFAPAYSSRMTDLPTYFLTYASAGRSYKVQDYDGAPASLKHLEASLEKLIDTKRWRRLKK